ncbi:MAG: PQQ-binding-like beta-propeller repeat protein [Alphaproteobacteria bacterium]|nr:PQQ-binding-like beta-propeller repeat protein [Alphaproteobacteria bacterium]
MNGKALSRFVFLATTTLLAACGSDNNKIGSTVKGERIAVIEQAKTLEADKGLSNRKPELPREIVNLSWPQAGYDSEHAMPDVEVSKHPRIVWQSDIGEGSDSDFKLLAHPVADRGTVYTLDAQGLVRATGAKSGERKWEFDTTPKDSDDKAIGGGLAIDGGTLYATTGFGDVYALDAKTGHVKWRKSLLNPLRAAPTVANGRVYVVSIDNEISALDAATGEVLWHQSGIAESATLMGASGPAVQGDSVIVAYNSGEIYDLRAQNGHALWNYSLASATQAGALPAIADIRGLPVIDRNRVFAISHSGRIACIDQTTGDRVWESDIGGIDTPVVAGDAVFIYGGEGQLIALTRDTGRPMWVAPLQKLSDPSDKDSDPVVWTGPVLAGGRLWMVNSLGHLASFSPADGSPIDSFDLGSPLYLSPIVVDRTLYVVTDNGTLVALR